MPASFDHIEKLLSQGRNVEARNLAEEAMKSSSDLRLSQLFAMATSKSGAPRAAMEHLEPLYKQHPEDPETSGILGGIYKELFKKDQNTKYALLSRDTYSNNFIATKNYYTGINAATMSAIAGQSSRSREIAAEIIGLLEKSAGDFWEIATLGEAWLLSKNREKAIDFYFQARKLAGTDWGKINSVYNQLWLLNHYVPVPAEILKVFSPPGVVAFVGHMIDRPGRQPRFPESIEHQAKERIASAIKTLGAKIGLCSVACGSDILFAEAMAESGGEVSIWLPFTKEDFIETSLRFAGQSWIDRFEKLTGQFPVTYITQDAYGGHDDLFSFQSRVIMGSAIIRSAMNHTKPTLLTVLSGTDLQRKEGGTRDAIMLWPFQDRHVNIDPDNFINHAATKIEPTPAPATPAPSQDRPLLYFVCADLPGLSAGEQLTIWKPILEKVSQQTQAPVTLETTDILIASFHTISGAIDLAKDILKIPTRHGKTPPVRISLYANPGLLEKGVEDQKILAVTSVNRLRRFHSLIPGGALYALARFASALALEVNKYTLDYAGVILPEGESTPFEIYQVQPI